MIIFFFNSFLQILLILSYDEDSFDQNYHGGGTCTSPTDIRNQDPLIVEVMAHIILHIHTQSIFETTNFSLGLKHYVSRIL